MIGDFVAVLRLVSFHYFMSDKLKLVRSSFMRPDHFFLEREA